MFTQRKMIEMMKKVILFTALALNMFQLIAQDRKIAFAMHGGAGNIRRENITPEQEAQYIATLKEALNKGYQVLLDGGTSLDAVEQAIVILENSPLFNAGKGAVFTEDGRNELDASIMYGKTGKAGAVAGITTVKNPISAARMVMDHSQHVMMAGKGAEQFAAEMKLEIVDPSYFKTETQFKNWQKSKQPAAPAEKGKSGMLMNANEKFGTVGAVALDVDGNLAAGTSTGGMMNKRYGRIGDSPVIGAGTYADNTTCAVSCTGHGEFFIRNAVAYDISARMAYAGNTLKEASEAVITKLSKQGGEGGWVALDSNGNIEMIFNTPGMFRGFINEKGEAVVYIFR